ncbi:MAG: alpha/beta hydrolase [Alphaproteobacteria bacterium]|nr:alpha/beta hydrolase [Alphaproteobacteria bacterium]
MTIHSFTREVDGSYALHYDPAMGDAFQEPMDDVDLWAVYDRIQCPVLVLRGSEPEILTAETAREMTERGPRAELVEFEGCGLAPALMNEEQIAVVHDWLRLGVEEDEGQETETSQDDDVSEPSGGA